MKYKEEKWAYIYKAWEYDRGLMTLLLTQLKPLSIFTAC